jgi:hypothetical protein
MKRPAALLVSLLASVCSPSWAAELRPLPYPPSEVLAGLEWTSEPHLYPGIESDMHWQTWAADDSIYSVDGDGGFFGGKHYYVSLSRITGTPPNHKIELITQFKDLDIRQHSPEGMQRYMCGPVAVGTDLYVCLYDYDWRLPGKDITKREEMLAVDRYSKHGGIPGIILSRDGGKTWSDVPKKETPRFLGPNYGNLQFIAFGPGYTGVPEELGGYVYAVSNDSNWESGDHLYLARVPRDKILERSAWEFFSGKADAPEWSKSEEAANPIFRDPGHVGHSEITYNATAETLLALRVQRHHPSHRDGYRGRDEGVGQANRATDLRRPNALGPWGLVYREEPWGGPNHACYLPHLPAKWLGSDGLSGWMLYSGDWVNHHYPKREYYGYMTRVSGCCRRACRDRQSSAATPDAAPRWIVKQQALDRSKSAIFWSRSLDGIPWRRVARCRPFD